MACALSAAAAAWGKECLDVAFPDQVEDQGASLKLNGLGVRKATFFKIKVYVAALYVPRPTANAQALVTSREPFELDLQFVRDVGAKDIRDAFAEGFAPSTAGHPSLQGQVATLESWIEDIRAGERMSFVRVPERGVQFSLAGRVKGILSGEHPPNAELKAGLLGGACR